MNAFIKTDETTCIIAADTLIYELGDTLLYAYNGESLTGVWRIAEVKAAYLTEGKR